jgi:H+-transporting ATPase
VHGATEAARSAADIVLMEPGLSAIVDGIVTSRQIFQRMRSYAVYRITSTVHFMVFMFFMIIIFNWTLPPTLIVLIALLNDAATLVISVDNAKISNKPDKWRLGQLMTLSVVLGLILTCASFGHFFIARDVFNVSSGELETIMYLQMSSCPHFVIFSTRLAVPFWHNAPSLSFFLAIVGTQIFAMLISVYGLLTTAVYVTCFRVYVFVFLTLTLSLPLFLSLLCSGWPWAIVVMSMSVAFFVLMDLCKCLIYRVWSFDLTVRLWPSKERKAKQALRLARRAVLDRYHGNLSKIKRMFHVAIAAQRFAGPRYQKLPDAVMAPVAPHKH